jgi:UDP-glucose 4-epimerase
MKIFITGVAGFLGSHLADRMLALGHEVVGVDNLLGGYIENVSDKVEFHIADCCDIEKMTELMAGCDIVCHSAATAHEGLSMFSPDFITKNIFQASVATISAAIQNKVKRFVYCSSMARYGELQAPFVETMDPKPVDPYGVAKYAGEEVLRILAETHGMEWNIAVPHNIVGPRQRYDDPFRNVLSIMTNRILQGKPPIIYGDGLQTRCFSDIEDCIVCLEKMLLDPNIKSEVINIGPDENTITVKELSDIICRLCDFKEPAIHMSDRPGEVKHASCSADKARKLLGYKTKHSVEKSVQDTINFIKEKGVKPFDYKFPLEIVNELTPKTWKDRLM